MLNIKRKNYLGKIEPFKDKSLIKILTGQRRVGKSYLLMQVEGLIKQQQPTSKTIFINKEKYEFDVIKNYQDLIEYVESKLNKKEKSYLFIDEIQDILQFEKALRHFNTNENLDIYITGSNAKLLSGELATFLSGRYIEIKVYSLSWDEFITFHKLPNNNESLEEYIKFGGLPYLINLPKEENVVFEYLKNIYSTIIYKDVVARYNIRNTNFLENLVKFTANNVGSILSAKKISDYLKSQNIKISPQVVLTYLDYLQQSFLIYKVNRADIVGKKIFEVGEKYFFEDWGLKNAIIGYKQQNINQVLENIVFLHLKISGYEIYVGKIGEKIIDFICEKSGERVYIQVTYLMADEKVKDREFGNLLNIKDNWKKIVVSLDPHTLKTFKGIDHFHLREFLTTFR